MGGFAEVLLSERKNLFATANFNIRAVDANDQESQHLVNVQVNMRTLIGQEKNLMFLGNIKQSGTQGMRIDADPLQVFSKTAGEILVTNAAAGNITVTAADLSDPRIDIVEIQEVRTNTDTTTRNQVDPVTGVKSSASVDIKKTMGVKIQVKDGTPGATPVAPATTAGFAKIAEILVGTGVTTIVDANIQNVDAILHGENTGWTTEKDITALYKGIRKMQRRGFEPWAPEVLYEKDDKFENLGKTFKVVNPHTSATDIQVDIDSGDIIEISELSASGAEANTLLNPSGRVFQRADGTAGPDRQIGTPDLVDGGYFVDRWKILSNDTFAGTNIVVGQRDATHSFFVNLGADNKRIAILQWVSAENTDRYQAVNGGLGKASISLLLKHNAGGAKDIRVALINTSASFVDDLPPNDPIDTAAWSVDPKPDLISDVSYSVKGGGTTGDVNFSIPTGGTFSRIVIEDITVGASKNIGVMIFLPVDDALTEWNFKDVQLSPRVGIPAYSERDFGFERDLCRFYFERLVGQGRTTFDGDIFAKGFVTSTTTSDFHVLYTKKRISPIFTSSAAANFSIVTSATATAVASSIALTLQNNLFGRKIIVTHAAIAGPQVDNSVELVASNGVVATMDLDSEL